MTGLFLTLISFSLFVFLILYILNRSLLNKEEKENVSVTVVSKSSHINQQGFSSHSNFIDLASSEYHLLSEEQQLLLYSPYSYADQTSISYKVVFKDENNGTEYSLYVTPNKFNDLSEGDSGVISFKGNYLVDFSKK